MKAGVWAMGRWPQIIAALVGEQYTDGKHHPCPLGHGTDCFRFSNVNGRGNYFCKCSDGSADGFELLQCVHRTDFKGAAKLVEDVIGPRPRDENPAPRPQSFAERLRSQATRAPRSRYLEGRGLTVPPGLQWHSALEYHAEGQLVGKFPAMLAPVTRAGVFLTFHVTYLANGEKAPVDPCRKILPGPGLKGAAVELYPPGAVLGIAEGIETAIAAHMLFHIPVWSCLNTSLMKSWRPPEGVERVIVFGDHDDNFAGQAAAYALAHRLHGELEVEVRFPHEPGDWNDALLARLVEAREP